MNMLTAIEAVAKVLYTSPFILLIELPLTLALLLGLIRWWLHKHTQRPRRSLYQPKVSCLITCYNEGRDVHRTLQSLWEQSYPGELECIPVIDGAAVNRATLAAVRQWPQPPSTFGQRRLKPIAKWQRGGRVSSLNAGLAQATGDIVLALDGDTSFDHDMVAMMVRHFENPDVAAVAGNLRVRNTWQSMATVMQAIEYRLSIGMARIGLAEAQVLNIISGALGGFRRSLLIQLGGWDTHSAEDLDLTLRLKNYCSRHPKLRIQFEPAAIGHTDVPTTFLDLLKQRLRWDGDLFFLCGRKHRRNLWPSLMGWRNFYCTIIYGLFVQVVLPFIILIDCTMLLANHPLQQLTPVVLTIYAAYLAVSALQFALMITLCSERPGADLRLLPFLPLFPLVMGMLRIWSAVAMLNELLCRSHEDTSMAPWWVIRRAHRF